jgi:hypothetical protein
MPSDFKLPFSAGAETSSVSFDPRRQIAPTDDEVTQVTQSGGQPTLDVGSTINAQFADGTPGNTQQELNDRADAYVMKRKGVFAEYATKSLKQKKLAQKATVDQINKMKDKKALDARLAKQEKSKQAQAARRHNEQVQVAAQSKRRKMWSSINEAEGKHAVLHKAKIEVAQKTDVKTTDTRTTNVKDTGVRDANVAQADPTKNPNAV